MIKVSSIYYGDAFGLAPIALSSKNKNQNKKNYWSNECVSHPTRIACLQYDT